MHLIALVYVWATVGVRIRPGRGVRVGDLRTFLTSVRCVAYNGEVSACLRLLRMIVHLRFPKPAPSSMHDLVQMPCSGSLVGG
ncbi:hypothetical protein B0I72DRAFT_137393 [Yarrowia lipolytica]|jgi:hypothetical protein|uniref:Secreted protein n=1 Tax=Yarrowia lipolytica TaxID=4952 RepID=A0A371CC88_YARLL|nr:hypothetical protein BKA91DRAFT_138561 [Yarrowia lipolytica]KAE8171712.1 hypothetical protein BKA90DRAFT_138562 [Yarrowia lipolytica]RDW27909.1 hypothetical protein B0I71DRAFT_128263 [Yarrowia lipolytica]RDW32843.1 hypothetical protein B0I72DRAFT_137393 [Yarrowia lipolytica]RDW37595.1 hypothetical protein B0I73DRAFT_135202 [Yarrowia lipolytica]